MEESQKAKEVAAMYEVESVTMPQPTPMQNQKLDRTAQTLKAQMAAQGVHLSDRDLEVLQAYLASEPQWETVYRRLADA